MITFVEKSPWHDSTIFTGDCLMYPTYMQKEGKEFFVFNRREPADSDFDTESEEAYKKQLMANDGAYLTFHGFWINPFDMLKSMAKRKLHFANSGDLYSEFANHGFIYFEGNLREVSAAFMYRIYDTTMAEKLQNVVSLLIAERWDNALEMLKED
jgi:hypothetical protein